MGKRAKSIIFRKIRPYARSFERDRKERDCNSFKGFTLIELMVVVVIIGIISAVLVPAFLGMREKEAPKEAAVPKEVKPTLYKEPDLAEKKMTTGPPPIVPITESADVNVKLAARNYLHKLKVYTIFDATFKSRFTFRNHSDHQDRIRLVFPFPEGTTQARNVSLKFLDSSGAFFEPEGVTYTLKGIRWVGPLAPGKELTAEVTYGAQGYDKFVYEGPGAGRAGSFRLAMALEGVTSEFIPAETLQPTKVGPGYLEWDYHNLVTDRKVIVELPGALSPIGRIILLSELAGLAIFLFGLGFLYLSELKQPGQLDNFRWGDFLLLALNYFLFFIVFMVFSLEGEFGTWAAMGFSVLLSLPLLFIHVCRILDWSFALARVLPLTVFTLAIVINGVYGDEYRNYIFIGFTVMTIALLTLTYKKWMEGRKVYREAKDRRIEEQKRLEREKNIKEKIEKKRIEKRRLTEQRLKKAFQETGRRLNELEAFAAEAKMLLENEDTKGWAQKEGSIEKMAVDVSEIRRKHADALSRVDDIGEMTDREDFVVFCSNIEQENLKRRGQIETIIHPLRGSVKSLKQFLEQANIQAGADGLRHCISCGVASPSFPYCPQCGVLSPLELKCHRCGEAYKLPIHLIAQEKSLESLHCMVCGEKYDAISLSEKRQSAEEPALP